jgi:hypothetical protein
LAQVHQLPAPAGGVLGEHGGMVVRVAIGVKQANEDEDQLPYEEQRCG